MRTASYRSASRSPEIRATGRLWGGLDFRFAAHAVDHIDVDLDELELSCERTATTLVPCYGDLVTAVRSRSREFHAVLTEAFARLISDIFIGRVGRLDYTGLPAELVIRHAIPIIAMTNTNATLHLELDATLAASP